MRKHGARIVARLIKAMVAGAWVLPSGASLADTVTRGPYLQMATPQSVVVRWRTDVATDSRVLYGSSPSSLTESVQDATATTEHIISVTGLTADTQYFYAVGTSSTSLAGGDGAYFWVTSPTVGSVKATRIWVIGDSGTGLPQQSAVRNAYEAFTGSRATDLWLILGDNAYPIGTDGDYQVGFFNMYPTHLRNTVVWPTFGNHDGISADSATQSGPYYDIFTLPTLGQAGGEPSGTEAYYSFDYANIHFICLDSYETNRAPGSAMLTWLQTDLAAATAEWIIAFWHHPPYSKGSHNSDTETELIDMRQNALPILEDHGVDLVLSGHSHSYERSVLLDGHYGLSSTLTGNMIIDGGDGREDGNGAYRKVALAAAPHEGAVYAVAGSSGQISGGTLNHPVMYLSLNELGSMVLDVDGHVLTAKFINSTGVIRDHFTMAKGILATAPLCPTQPRNGCRQAKRSQLVLKEREPHRRDRLTWRWQRGAATDVADFGAPATSTDYALCVYDQNGAVQGAQVSSGAHWSTVGSGLRYRDGAGSQAGVRRIALRSGTSDRARITYAAMGERLPDPSLNLTAPVIAQLVNSASAVCWEATYAGPSVIRNDTSEFRAKAVMP